MATVERARVGGGATCDVGAVGACDTCRGHPVVLRLESIQTAQLTNLEKFVSGIEQ